MTRWIDARVPVAFGGAAQTGDALLTGIAQPGDALLTGIARPGDALLTGIAQPGDALLTGIADTGHPAACACCIARTPAAEALGRLFLQRARGEVAFFRRVMVVAGAEGQAAVREALRSDPVVTARFRLDAE